MALTRRTGGTAVAIANGNDNAQLAWPTGVSANDLAFISVSWYENGDRTCTTPTDFSIASNSFAYSGSGTGESRSMVFYKVCAGTETGALYVNFSSTVYATVTLDVFDGTNSLTFVSASTPNSGTGVTDATAPSVMGTAGQGLFVAYLLSDSAGTTNSGPSGMTMGADGAASAVMALRTYYQDVTSSVPTGTKTWDFTTSRDFAGVSILFDGAGEAGGGSTAKPHYYYAQL